MLTLALFLLVRSRAKGVKGKIRNTDTTMRCKAGRGFISINEHNKKYSLKSRNDKKITTKFTSRLSKKDILTCIQRIPQTTFECVVPSLCVMSGLGNMLLFMYFLNFFRLINITHRNVLTDITEKINSNIFLFNTIIDVVNMIPKEIPTFCILSFFSLTQLLSHTFLSRFMSYLFYSKEEREGNVTIIREKQIGISAMGDFQSCGSTKGGENNQEDGNITIVEGITKGVVKRRGTHENSRERIDMLKHMCTLSHTGLVTMYVFNRIQKSLNCCNDNMSVFVNFYTLVSGLFSKLYIYFFVKKKKLVENGKTTLSFFKSIFSNVYFYSFFISLFFKFFPKCFFFYQVSLKQSLNLFHTILTPSIFIILSNIMYEGTRLKSPFLLKDLLFVLHNKYILIPSFFFVLLYINNLYGYLNIPKTMLLFFLVQSMTPPNYGVYLLSVRQEGAHNRGHQVQHLMEKFEGLDGIRKVLAMSYPLYLIPMFVYTSILHKYLKYKM
ncbi:conserved Plasmodium protein, unknown function [Plasmodium ovale]|uniref:Apicoplast integral membrane protein n=1 Tax=Plasmodium ovale TaxID=36330 RepID=A0A1C3KQA4_PLAOA|nr:conserved Plasmodium protein, unknown function [Plasmodium ovale]